MLHVRFLPKERADCVALSILWSVPPHENAVAAHGRSKLRRNCGQKTDKDRQVFDCGGTRRRDASDGSDPRCGINHQSGRANLRQPELAPGRPPRPDPPRGLHLQGENHPFDHERIPERIVHARGSGAHGYFEPYKSCSRLTRAAFLQDPKRRTPVFVRFSTVAGGAGSGDTPRDVRGFAVKFYTEEGNFDLVGNNIPVFFIQDAIKFPDLIHSVKMEPDRGYPQAASAHDTFWDFISLMPESLHMILWAMSDRTLPRSLRMMEGFGVHTFRFVNASGVSTLVKFRWSEDRLRFADLGRVGQALRRRPRLPAPGSSRRDRHGRLPGVRVLGAGLRREDRREVPLRRPRPDQDHPGGSGTLQPLGRMVLDRNAENFFAETEQVAFHPGHVVPGIDFTNDPLLQGRLFWYTDTQLLRLGGANFHEIPINRPKCPMRNFQRDGVRRMDVNPGQVAYEPNSLASDSPREDPQRGFTSIQRSTLVTS